MGGHGGLNILPQKRWNVYNYENREKVRRDEEQAAREEQLKREQARKRDSEFRLERLRTAKGLAPLFPPPQSQPKPSSLNSEPEPSSDPGHINLFEGIKIFDPIREPQLEGPASKKKMEVGGPRPKPTPVTIVGPEDDKYRLGYGLAGKGVQLPWYVQNKSNDDGVGNDNYECVEGNMRDNKGEKKRKSIEELREERLKREKKENHRERALKREKEQSRRDVYGSSRWFSR